MGEVTVPNIDAILGPHEVGVMVAIFLFGLVTIQTFSYYRKYPDDHKALKALVGFIWTLLFSHTILGAFSLYRRTITNYGRPATLVAYPEGMCGAFSISGVIGSTVQSYFAYRLRKLSGRLFISLTCWTLSLARVGALFFISVSSCQAETVQQFEDQWAWLVIVTLSVSAFVDIMIAGALSYCLWVRRKHVFKYARKVVDKLIVWFIQTGILTSISSLLVVILYLSIKNWAWASAYMVISGVFANFLLASLNARRSLRNEMHPSVTFLDMSFDVPLARRDSSLMHTTNCHPGAVEVNISGIILAQAGRVDNEAVTPTKSKPPDLERGPLDNI